MTSPYEASRVAILLLISIERMIEIKSIKSAWICHKFVSAPMVTARKVIFSYYFREVKCVQMILCVIEGHEGCTCCILQNELNN